MPSPKRSPDTETSFDWAELPVELSAAIAKRLVSIRDYISFRGVCESWRSAATFENFDREYPRVPWLMYFNVEEEGKEIAEGTKFLNMSENKTYHTTDFPPGTGAYLSCRGWILYISENMVDVNLTHPVWRIKIELPCLDTFPAYKLEDGVSRFISKMVLSCSPTTKTDLVVMVIWGEGNQLGFSRPGDSSWTVLDSWDDSFCDIIYHNGRLYAVDVRRRVVECDIHGPNPGQILQVFSLPKDHGFSFSNKDLCYFVESSGKFLIVSRHFNDCKTMRFQILELDLMDGSHKEIFKLGKRALFLGFNTSFCLERTASINLKPNCIYFTDHIWRCMHLDTGVYCLFNGRIKDFGGFPGSVHAPPLWVLPSF
ncbi:F-box protein At2g26160-like [Sesamum indicum]|uniref:F-box protein At2g26160-like n=1 Tax=Sesamum indicum TaxID=4182 RepID=A0A6I9T9I9_SESIN|nr:F-box protein At2g26160-like [Sesamum indicum]